MTYMQLVPSPRQQTPTSHSTDQHFENLFKRKLRKAKVSYSVLLKFGQESFVKRMVSVQDIAEVAKIYPDQPELSHTTLSRMKSVDEVWVTFRKHTSWYNSELVEAVVRLYGGESNQEHLKVFERDRTSFVHYLGHNSDQRKRTTMILKLEEDFNQFSKKRLEQVCLTLCDLLETNTCPLDVEEGCIKITISVSADVAENVFPLPPTLKKALQKAFPTLISISCGRTLETFEASEVLTSSVCVQCLNTLCICLSTDYGGH